MVVKPIVPSRNNEIKMFTKKIIRNHVSDPHGPEFSQNTSIEPICAGLETRNIESVTISPNGPKATSLGYQTEPLLH